VNGVLREAPYYGTKIEISISTSQAEGIMNHMVIQVTIN
jgi:hypothetical protein